MPEQYLFTRRFVLPRLIKKSPFLSALSLGNFAILEEVFFRPGDLLNHAPLHTQSVTTLCLLFEETHISKPLQLSLAKRSENLWENSNDRFFEIFYFLSVFLSFYNSSTVSALACLIHFLTVLTSFTPIAVLILYRGVFLSRRLSACSFNV